MQESNVRAFATKGKNAEDMLNAALAECAETRSRGKVPDVIVMILEEGCFPGLFRTPMLLNDLAACQVLLSNVVDRAIDLQREDRNS